MLSSLKPKSDFYPHQNSDGSNHIHGMWKDLAASPGDAKMIILTALATDWNIRLNTQTHSIDLYTDIYIRGEFYLHTSGIPSGVK